MTTTLNSYPGRWLPWGPRIGTVHGIPTLAGELFAVDGPLALLRRHDGAVFIIHKENFRSVHEEQDEEAKPEPRKTKKQTAVNIERYI